jgi:hypothetical protein
LDLALSEKNIKIRMPAVRLVALLATPADRGVLLRIGDLGLSNDEVCVKLLPTIASNLWAEKDFADRCIERLCSRTVVETDVELLEIITRSRPELIRARFDSLVSACARDHRALFVRALTVLIPVLDDRQAMDVAVEVSEALIETTEAWP